MRTNHDIDDDENESYPPGVSDGLGIFQSTYGAERCFDQVCPGRQQEGEIQI
jgi:hypothetical protein